MLRHDGAVSATQLSKQPSRPLDVSEDERQGPGGGQRHNRPVGYAVAACLSSCAAPGARIDQALPGAKKPCCQGVYRSAGLELLGTTRWPSPPQAEADSQRGYLGAPDRIRSCHLSSSRPDPLSVQLVSDWYPRIRA